jgi:hypothetical protein
MSILTLTTGFMGEWDTIFIDWSNENNVHRQEKIDIIIKEQDKPRVLEIRLNDVVIATINSRTS